MRRILGLIFLLFCMAFAPQALAYQTPKGPSFDCAKAFGDVERAICDSGTLPAFDRQLAALFSTARDAFTGQDRADLIDSQRAWLRDRALPCPPYAQPATLTQCLEARYQDRIQWLERIAKGSRENLTKLLWSPGVVCDGDRALVRMVEDEDQFTGRPPPAVGGRLARVAPSAESCKLADGREVRFRIGGGRDGTPYGMCGAQETQFYSVWIGQRRVISREVQADKCDADPVRAVYLDGKRLTICGRTEPPREDKNGAPVCRDASAKLKSAKIDPPSGPAFRVAFAASGQEAFCKSLIHKTVFPDLPDAYAPRDWPELTAEPRTSVVPVKDGETANDQLYRFDINNSGKASDVIVLAGFSHYFDGDLWVIPPKGMNLETARAKIDKVTETEDPAALRRQGFQIFAGDQTPYRGLRYTRFTPFRKDGQTWLFATWAVPRLDLPTQVITRPMPDGTQKLICRYQAIPAF